MAEADRGPKASYSDGVWFLSLEYFDGGRRFADFKKEFSSEISEIDSYFRLGHVFGLEIKGGEESLEKVKEVQINYKKGRGPVVFAKGEQDFIGTPQYVDINFQTNSKLKMHGDWYKIHFPSNGGVVSSNSVSDEYWRGNFENAYFGNVMVDALKDTGIPNFESRKNTDDGLNISLEKFRQFIRTYEEIRKKDLLVVSRTNSHIQKHLLYWCCSWGAVDLDNLEGIVGAAKEGSKITVKMKTQEEVW